MAKRSRDGDVPSDPVAIVRSSFTRAVRHERRRAVTPLARLRAGDLAGALDRADRDGLERRTAWYLLLAWELGDTRRRRAARRVLRRLARARTAIARTGFIDGWEAAILVLFARVPAIDGALFRRLLPAIFPEGELGRRHLLERLIRQGLHEDVLQLIGWPGKDAFLERVDERGRSLHAQIAIARAESGDGRGAVALAGAIADACARAQVLADVALARERSGDSTGAIRTARAIETPHARASALAGLAVARAGAGAHAAARRLLAEALAGETAERLPERRARLFALTSVAFAKLGETRRARELLRRARTCARRARGVRHFGCKGRRPARVVALASVAEALLEGGTVDEAIAVAEGLDWAEKQDELRIDAIERLGVAGRQDDARRLLDRLDDDFKRMEGLSKLAVSLARRGDRDAARRPRSRRGSGFDPPRRACRRRSEDAPPPRRPARGSRPRSRVRTRDRRPRRGSRAGPGARDRPPSSRHGSRGRIGSSRTADLKLGNDEPRTDADRRGSAFCEPASRARLSGHSRLPKLVSAESV